MLFVTYLVSNNHVLKSTSNNVTSDNLDFYSYAYVTSNNPTETSTNSNNVTDTFCLRWIVMSNGQNNGRQCC